MYGYRFLGYNSAIFWPIELKFMMGTQETIIYRLRNHDFDDFMKNIFLAGKNERGKK